MENVVSLADKIIRKTEELKARRLNFETLWQEVTELVLPRKADFTVHQTNGSPRTRKLFETTAVHAAEILGAGVHGLMTNPSGKWFMLSVPEHKNNPEIATWLKQTEQVMNNEILRPCVGFSTNIHEVYMDLVVLGTAGLYVGWNEDKNALLFQSRFLAELFIEENPAGQIDTVYRTFKMTLNQIVKTWGVDNLSEKLKALYQADVNDEKEFEIIHAIMPNLFYNAKSAFQKPISSVYILKEERIILFEGGFEEMPLFVTRWNKACAEVYGRSPAISVLPDIKMIQEMMKETIVAAQLANRPPLLVRDDDQFAPIATIPGGIIRYSGEAPKAFEVGGDAKVGIDVMNEVRNRIKMAFYNNQLTDVENLKMTATEVLQRTEEKMRLFAPVFGRMQTELFGPMMKRIFGLLVRHSKLVLPEGIEFDDVKVEYLSPLSFVQKHLEATAIMKTLEMAQGFLQIQPEAATVFNVPEAIKKIGEMYGVGNDLFNFERNQEISDRIENQESTENLDVNTSV